MQDQNEHKVVKSDEDVPKEMIEQMKRSEAVLFVGVGEDGAVAFQGAVAGGVYRPEQNPAHAFVAAIYSEHRHLLDIVNNRPTDATRFRALRSFALLKKSDEARFNAINEMLQKFEHDHKLDDEAARIAEDHNAIADFIAIALLETEPVELHETTVNTDAPAVYAGPKLVLPH